MGTVKKKTLNKDIRNSFLQSGTLPYRCTHDARGVQFGRIESGQGSDIEDTFEQLYKTANCGLAIVAGRGS